ncbi:MAG: alpha/beta fold hydrolase [Gemmatimonadaceae bacterium]
MKNSAIRRMSAPLTIERLVERLETLSIDGRGFAYQDAGGGPAVILAHCSGASHRAWASLVGVLKDHYRVLAPDLLGYGRSEPWPVNARLHPWSDLGAVLGLAELADGPVHLVGHSYGGAVALEAARVLGTRVRSLTLIEPVAFHLLRLTGRMAEWREITSVGQQVTAALRRRQDKGAAWLYMRYWSGRLRWWTMSPRARRGLVESVGKVGAEFEVLSQLSSTIGDYQCINMPTRLIAGERSPAPARAIVDELEHILPNAHQCVLRRAGHMSPLTHPSEVTALVSAHIVGAEAMQERRGQRSIA